MAVAASPCSRISLGGKPALAGRSPCRAASQLRASQLSPAAMAATRMPNEAQASGAAWRVPTYTNHKPIPMRPRAGWLNSSSGCSPGLAWTLTRGMGGGSARRAPGPVPGTAPRAAPPECCAGGTVTADAGAGTAGPGACSPWCPGACSPPVRLAALPAMNRTRPAAAVSTHKTRAAIANGVSLRAIGFIGGSAGTAPQVSERRPVPPPARYPARPAAAARRPG